MTAHSDEGFPLDLPSTMALQTAPEMAALVGLAAQAKIAIVALRARAVKKELDAAQLDQARAIVERLDAAITAIELYRRAIQPL